MPRLLNLEVVRFWSRRRGIESFTFAMHTLRRDTCVRVIRKKLVD